VKSLQKAHRSDHLHHFSVADWFCFSQPRFLTTWQSISPGLNLQYTANANGLKFSHRKGHRFDYVQQLQVADWPPLLTTFGHISWQIDPIGLNLLFCIRSHRFGEVPHIIAWFSIGLCFDKLLFLITSSGRLSQTKFAVQ